MHKNNVVHFNAIQDAFGEFVAGHKEITERLNTETSIEEQADNAYVLRQITDMAEEMAKNSRATYDLATRILCARWAKESQDGAPIRTPFCRISPKVRLSASLPKKGTPEYAALMIELGVAESVIESDAVRPHWPGMTDYITSCLESGKPLPQGLSMDKTYPVYSLTIYKFKGITE